MKKIMALTLATITAFGLVACGGTGDGNGDSGSGGGNTGAEVSYSDIDSNITATLRVSVPSFDSEENLINQTLSCATSFITKIDSTLATDVMDCVKLFIEEYVTGGTFSDAKQNFIDNYDYYIYM